MRITMKLKVLAVVLCGLMLVACSPNTKYATHNFVLPEELSHCKMYKMYDGYRYVFVMHCPNATTSTMVSGKHPVRSVMVSE